MTDVSLVLETSALLAYAGGVTKVGARIRDAADDTEHVVVPALCLAEAYRRTDSDGWHMLDVLVVHPNVIVAPVERDMCGVLGGGRDQSRRWTWRRRPSRRQAGRWPAS